MNTVVVDARLRERRSAVARAEGRRRLIRLLAGLGAVTVLWAGWSAANSSLLGVRSIHVNGAPHIDREELLAAARVPLGTPMLHVDTASIEARLGALAWVDHVSVHRKWPATIAVDIVERRPVAATAAADGTWRFVDRHGRVLFTATKLISGVPTVDGPVNPGAPGSSLPPASQLAYEAIARVPPALAGKVAGAAWNGDGSTSLTLSSGREVLLPPADRLGDAFVALATVLASPKTGTGIIDLRAPNAPAIQPAAPATTLAVPSLTQVTL